jgi:acetyl esterase/lipase
MAQKTSRDSGPAHVYDPATTTKNREAQLKQFGITMGFLLSAIFAAPALAQTPQLVTEEMMVKTGDPGIEIYVRNKRPANMTSFRPEQTVLYVHGATYPAETAFDLKLDGQSWMEYIASRGYDVWLLDYRASPDLPSTSTISTSVCCCTAHGRTCNTN